jgi:hypothetical protein
MSIDCPDQCICHETGYARNLQVLASCPRGVVASNEAVIVSNLAEIRRISSISPNRAESPVRNLILRAAQLGSLR